ncbi:MAG TPA: prenyltransferase/squalene oxidase repeat-containing protein [Planctomycetota bacterium]
MIGLLLAIFTLSGVEGLAQGGAVEQGKIDAAVKKGVEWLKKAPSPGFTYGKIDDSDPLILLTLIHAGVPESDARVQELLKGMLEKPLMRTYLVTLQAMVLEEIDRAKYQNRIAQCAQFLVDNQCSNGQWSYGEPSEHVKEVPPAKDVASGGGKKAGVIDFGGGGGEKVKPKITRKITVKKMKDGPGIGDNSNTMYAALGLRACHDSGILLPKDVVEAARRWFVECQFPAESNNVASGDGAVARGWCYARKDVCAKKHGAYGGMTAGATGALVIYNYILGTDWKRDPAVRSGNAWMAQKFAPDQNPGENELGNEKTELYYTLYAAERLGMLSGQTLFGKHDWYVEGASFLLGAQKESGGWDDGVGRSTSTWDTCFAILFLKKATRALVASEDVSKRRDSK